MAKRSKVIAVAVAVCCMLVLTFTLTGCGADKSNYTGDWKLTSSTDANLDGDSIALMDSIGFEVNLSLKEDGTGFLKKFGEVRDITWTAASNTEGKVSMGDAETAMELSDGQLTLADVDGAALTFSRSGS